jgi:tetratricopeptide (TPR) repeat protein
VEDAGVSRRKIVAGGLVLGAGSAAIGAWSVFGSRPDPRVTELLHRGEQAMRVSLPETNANAAKALRDATRLDPSNARAWGLLALTLRDIAEETDPAQVSKAVVDTETAARRALAIDPLEANARTALATVRPEFGNWDQTEDALRAILKDSPDNVAALSYMVMILQAVGRARESWDLNERAVALDPLSPVLLFRRGLKLWILGRVPEADLAIDRALQLWPKHPAVWNARLYIFAFTGRAGAALAALDDASQRPERFRKPAIDFWRSSLRALETGSREDVKEAVRINVEAAPKSPYFAAASMMVLSMLNELDSAFAVAEGALLRRGPLIGTLWAGKNTMAVYDQYWRRTMNLFTPATAAMRADPRFRSLCDGMGMIGYWRKRGIGPDAMYKLAF